MSDAIASDLTIPAFLDRNRKPSLDELAHEINVRLQKADDHRLSAALKLAEAQAACKEQGVPFKRWVQENITGLGYPEATKLAKIGSAPEPAQALADFRAVRASREKTRRVEAVGHVANSDPVIALPRPARGKEAIAARVRDALVALSGLPPPGEVVGFLRGSDAAVIVNDHLGPAASWMADFAEIWRDYAEAAE